MSVVYTLYDALVSINVPDDKAKAVIDAMEREMMDKLATKADLIGLRSEMGSEFKLVRQEMTSMRDLLSKDIQALGARIDHLTYVMTVRLFGAAAVMIGAIAAIQKLR